MNCPYCSRPAVWVDNAVIYGKSYGRSHMIWYCENCDAYVGCHDNTQTPLGTMANAELRALRVEAHNVFDPLWKSGRMPRAAAYRLLSEHFHKETHIGESDIDTCNEIIDYLKGIGA